MNRWILGARPRTLPAAVVPVALGTATVFGSGEIVWWRAGAALVVALALQVATNYVNDYADGERGTDTDRVGPVRLVGQGMATAGEVKRAALVAFGVAGIAGAALAWAVGWEMLVVGALSMIAGWAYTGGPKPYGYLGLGEVFVFVFFGLVATVGSAYVHVVRIEGLAVVAGVLAGFLAVALLVVNNLRDIPGDTVSGKRTLAVRMGDATTRHLYLALVIGSFVTIGVAALWRPAALLGFVGVAAAIAPVRAVRSGARGAELIPVLGGTGRLQLATGVATAVGLAIGG